MSTQVLHDSLPLLRLRRLAGAHPDPSSPTAGPDKSADAGFVESGSSTVWCLAWRVKTSDPQVLVPRASKPPTTPVSGVSVTEESTGVYCLSRDQDSSPVSEGSRGADCDCGTPNPRGYLRPPVSASLVSFTSDILKEVKRHNAKKKNCF